MGKTPDTRNKLESVKVPKKKKVAKNKNNYLKETFGDLLRESEEGFKPARGKHIQKTKGQIFKETHGFSRSTYRAMKKRGLAADFPTFEVYKLLRRNIKKAAKKIAQDKRSVSRVVRKSGGTKTSKKK